MTLYAKNFRYYPATRNVANLNHARSPKRGGKIWHSQTSTDSGTFIIWFVNRPRVVEWDLDKKKLWIGLRFWRYNWKRIEKKNLYEKFIWFRFFWHHLYLCPPAIIFSCKIVDYQWLRNIWLKSIAFVESVFSGW